MAGNGLKVAYIDESARASTSGGFYLVAAAVLDVSSQTGIERALREALGRRRQRFHWRDESEKVRLCFLEAVAAQQLCGRLAAAGLSIARRQEKARESALWSLMPQLELLGVREMVLESREQSLNRRDRRTIGSIQRAGMAAEISFRFGLPKEEPLLWIADALAGAASAARATTGTISTGCRRRSSSRRSRQRLKTRTGPGSRRPAGGPGPHFQRAECSRQNEYATCSEGSATAFGSAGQGSEGPRPLPVGRPPRVGRGRVGSGTCQANRRSRTR